MKWLCWRLPRLGGGDYAKPEHSMATSWSSSSSEALSAEGFFSWPTMRAKQHVLALKAKLLEQQALIVELKAALHPSSELAQRLAAIVPCIAAQCAAAEQSA